MAALAAGSDFASIQRKVVVLHLNCNVFVITDKQVSSGVCELATGICRVRGIYEHFKYVRSFDANDGRTKSILVQKASSVKDSDFTDSIAMSLPQIRMWSRA